MSERVYTQTFGAVAAILERGGRFLLVKEQLGGGNPDTGKWSHPAGWLEVGEHPIEGIKREVKEETGFDFTPTHLLGVYSNVRHDIANAKGTPHAIKLVFVGEIGDAPTSALSDDVSETRWFTPEEINAMGIDVLRSKDIQKMIRDYLAGTHYPLTLVTHSVQS